MPVFEAIIDAMAGGGGVRVSRRPITRADRSGELSSTVTAHSASPCRRNEKKLREKPLSVIIREGGRGEGGRGERGEGGMREERREVPCIEAKGALVEI